MVELREETGVQRSLTERLVRSRLQWDGHVERMADDRLPKRAAELREEGRRRRGRPMLRWRKAGEEEDWKKKTRDRGGWKRLSDEAVKKVAGSTSPLTKGNEEDRDMPVLYLFIIIMLCLNGVRHDLSDSVVNITNVNTFKNRLDRHWREEDFLYNYEAPVPGHHLAEDRAKRFEHVDLTTVIM